MSTFTLPDSSDIRDTIADCLDCLGIAPEGERARIIENCLAPVALLFEAGEMASVGGTEERAVFAYFLSLMAAQARKSCATPAPASSTTERRKALEAPAQLPDSEINFDDIPHLTKEFWDNAITGAFYKGE